MTTNIRKSRYINFLLLIAVLNLLTACVSPASRSLESTSVQSMLETRRDRVVVQQWDLSCGAAVLATVLAYQHADPVPEREIATALINRKEYLANPELVRERQGFSLLDLKRYVERRGYEGSGFGQLTLADLKDRAPIILPISSNGYNHFVVFLGQRQGRVLLADPAWGKRTMTVEQFSNVWINFPDLGHVGFMVVEPGKLSTTHQLAPQPSDFVMFR